MAKALIDGDWDIEGGANYLFPYSVIREATLRLLPRKGFKYLGVDIARYGDDESVAIVRHGNTVSDVYNWMGTDTMESALRVFDIIREHNPAVVNIDVIGPGSGVVDKLRELGVKCNGVNASGKARNPDYHNARAEMFWRLRDLFEQGFISIPDHSKLTSQLAGIKYTFAANGTKAIVSKEEMRKSGSKSPDYADALALAFYSTTPAFNRIVSKSFTRYR
uniref:Putative terminase n=1 Tax=viral metagenome TaxID=1070528 RepID=A0A6M3J345_9ZZZZ